MVSNLRNGVLCQSHSAAHRNEIGLLQILTKAQAIAFLEWFLANKERCIKLFTVDKKMSYHLSNNDTLHPGVGVRGSENKEQLKASDSLSDICKQLTEAMMH